jgi:hypothetical protein
MVSQKLLVMSALARSLAKTDIHGLNPLLIPLPLLLSAPWLSRQVQAVIQELFHLENAAPTGAGGQADLCETSVLRKAFSGKLAASDTTWN